MLVLFFKREFVYPSYKMFKTLEPPRYKTNKIACAPSENSDREDSDQTAQSDQSLRCPHEASLGS